MIKTIKYFSLTFLILFFLSVFTFCKKDKFNTDPNAIIKFSADSVLFDTVFTQAGSTTKLIRVVNNGSKKIKISSIFLEKGNQSSFIVNVDGEKGLIFSDTEIAANDSIYIFIQVYVNPTSANAPVIISDNLIFNVNGNNQKVALEAWGQNAYYHKPTNAIKLANGSFLPYSTISASTNTIVTWLNDKPHIIYGWLVVDSSQTLIIPQNTKVYLYANAGLWTYRYGTLKVQGQKGSEVIFQGWRREAEYMDKPGQWDRIWINEGSVNNEINYAIIKNGYIGVQTDLLTNQYNADPRRLKITNTKIFNMSKWGLYSLGYNIYGANNVIANCGEMCYNLTYGGNYKFVHCTFANYWNATSRDLPCVKISNQNNGTIYPLDTCYFGNCIIDGAKESELSLDINYGSTNFQPKHNFNSCVLKTGSISNLHFTNCKFKQALNFTNVNAYDFRLNNNSAAKDFSNITDANLFPFDIDGSSRLPNPDCGAYEKN